MHCGVCVVVSSNIVRSCPGRVPLLLHPSVATIVLHMDGAQLLSVLTRSLLDLFFSAKCCCEYFSPLFLLIASPAVIDLMFCRCVIFLHTPRCRLYATSRVYQFLVIFANRMNSTRVCYYVKFVLSLRHIYLVYR
jgi:hypothetical protein